LPLGLHARQAVWLCGGLRRPHLLPPRGGLAPHRAAGLGDGGGGGMRRGLAVLVHVALVVACAFAVYPLLWVVTLALSPHGPGTEARVFPLATAPSLANFRAVLGLGTREGVWLFLEQLANSLVVSLATALVAVLVATSAAYAL